MRDEKGRFQKGITPHNKTNTNITCTVCGKERHVIPANKSQKYCSYKCYWKAKKGTRPHNKGKKYPHLTGKNSASWKGGKPRCKQCDKRLSIYKSKRMTCMPCISENSTYRNGAKYKKWAEDIKKRDDYTCQDCKKRGGYLESHHIKSWVKYPALRFEMSNGKTLCKDCHKKTDNYAYKAIL